MKNIKLALLAAALTSVTAVALAQNNTTPAAPEAGKAQPDQPRRNARFERLDTNKDGSIAQDEFVSAQNLKDADANNDGTLSNEELVAMVQKREAERQAERLTRRLDIDGDGKVTIAEVEKNKAKRFALLDRNDDGKLERDELRGGRHGGHGKHGRHGDHGRRDGHHGGHRPKLDL